MFVEAALAVEVAPLFDEEEGLLYNSLGVSFGSGILLFFEGVGEKLVGGFVLYFEGDEIWGEGDGYFRR